MDKVFVVAHEARRQVGTGLHCLFLPVAEAVGMDALDATEELLEVPACTCMITCVCFNYKISIAMVIDDS